MTTTPVKGSRSTAEFHFTEDKYTKFNPFYQKKVKSIMTISKTLLIRIPIDVLQMFDLNRHTFIAKGNPWSQKEYTENLMQVFPEIG